MRAVTYIIEILADGTAVVKDAAGKVIATIPKFAAKTSGGFVIRPSMIPDWLKGAKLTVRLAKCFGPITALMLLSELAYAGMDVSLGGAAAQIGVRLKDCQDRFAKHAAGIQCLVRQGPGTKCLDAVKACPDAFFGANMLASCGAEPGMQALIDALVAAINATSSQGGG